MKKRPCRILSGCILFLLYCLPLTAESYFFANTGLGMSHLQDSGIQTSWMRHTAFIPVYSLEAGRFFDLAGGNSVRISAGADYRETNRFSENGRRLPVGSIRFLQLTLPLSMRLHQPAGQHFFLRSDFSILPAFQQTGYAVYSDTAITTSSWHVSARGDWGIGAYIHENWQTSAQAFLSAGLPVRGEKQFSAGDRVPLDFFPLYFGAKAELSGSWQRYLFAGKLSYTRLNELLLTDRGSTYNASFRYKQAIQFGITTGIRW